MADSNPMYELIDKESTLGEMIENRAERIGEGSAVVFHDEVISYTELNRRIDALATALIGIGLKSEDRIATLLPTRPEFVYVWFAAAKIGASVVGLNYRYTKEEIAYMARAAEPKAMVCISEFDGVDYSEFMAAVKSEIPSIETFISVGNTGFPGALLFDDLLKTEPDVKKVHEHMNWISDTQDNFIIFTSGVTGEPKGAVLTQKSIMAMIRPWIKNLELRISDSLLCILPLNHVGGGTIMALSAIAAGATLILHDKFDPITITDIIKRNKVTIFGALPTVYEIMFIQNPDLTPESVPSLRAILYGGSPASPELVRKLKNSFGCPIVACYGSTEVSGFCTYTALEDPFDKTNTAGRIPEGVEIRILDPNNRKKTLPSNEMGEIAVRSDMLFDRYLDNPEATWDAFDYEGWYYTGDMGYVDNDGFLVVVGQSRERYTAGGKFVYPKEIEDRLAEHPAVALSAVIGMPHDVLGEAGWAFIVLMPGAEATENELIDFCRETLADYKVPERVKFVESLPISGVGKILKPRIRDFALSEFEK